MIWLKVFAVLHARLDRNVLRAGKREEVFRKKEEVFYFFSISPSLHWGSKTFSFEMSLTFVVGFSFVLGVCFGLRIVF